MSHGLMSGISRIIEAAGIAGGKRCLAGERDTDNEGVARIHGPPVQPLDHNRLGPRGRWYPG
ncbi:MAG: hypothetical protein HKP13_01810 [Gammaproteobacteria bacterium]|nr:hypothetical protein [Gammaproteobacteria bacterium]